MWALFLGILLLPFHLHAASKQDCLLKAKDRLATTNHELRALFRALEIQSDEVPCKADKPTVARKDWQKVKAKLWSNDKFRNTNPNGECNARATLISLELDKMGYKSEKIYIGNGKVAASLKTPKGYVVYPFLGHTANVVTLKEADGTSKKYVVDPMFNDDLVSIEDYLKVLNCPGADPLLYKLSHQTSEPGLFLETGHDVDKCVYHDFIVEGSNQLLEINKSVATGAGGYRMLNDEMDFELPILGPDRESAKRAYCSKIN